MWLFFMRQWFVIAQKERRFKRTVWKYLGLFLHLKTMKKIFALLFISVFSCFFSQKMYYVPYTVNSKYGIKDSKGNKITEPVYDNVRPFFNYYFTKIDTVSVFTKRTGSDGWIQGLISNRGNILIPEIYERLICEDGICLGISKSNGNKILNYRNQKIEEAEWGADQLQDSLIFYNRNGKRYFRKVGTSKLIGPFDNLQTQLDRKLILAQDVTSELRKILRYDGSVLYESLYLQTFSDFNNKIVQGDDIITVYDKQNRVFLTDFEKKNRICYKDYSANYKEFGDLCTTKKGKDSVCNIFYYDGIFSIIKRFKKIDDYDDPSYGDKESLIRIKKNGQYGYAFRDGRIAVKPQYDSLFSHMAFRKDERGKPAYYILDKKGQEIFKSKLSFKEYFPDENFIVARKPGTPYFYIIKNGKETKIKEAFSNLKSMNVPYESDFYVFRTSINNKDKYVRVDRKGNVTDIPFDHVSNFHHNRFFAMKDGKLFLADSDFNIIKTFEGSISWPYSNTIDKKGDFAIELNDKYGIVNYRGDVVIPFDFDRISKHNESLYEAYNLNSRREPKEMIFFDRFGQPITGKEEAGNQVNFFQHKNYYALIYQYKCQYYDNQGNYIGSEDDVDLPCRRMRDYE